MILMAIMELLKLLIYGIIALLPALPDMSGIISFIDSLSNVISVADIFVDIGVVSVCFGLIIAAYSVRFVWSVVMWVVRKIPGVS